MKDDSLQKLIKSRILSKSKSKTLQESLASLEELLFEAESKGNKRKADRIKVMIRCLKNKKASKK